MNKSVITMLNTMYVIIRPTKDFILPHPARRLEKLPTPGVDEGASSPVKNQPLCSVIGDHVACVA